MYRNLATIFRFNITQYFPVSIRFPFSLIISLIFLTPYLKFEVSTIEINLTSPLTCAANFHNKNIIDFDIEEIYIQLEIQI